MYRGYTKSWRKKYSGRSASRGLLYVGAMDWLAGNANWNDGWYDGVKVCSGQIMISLQKLSVEWNVSLRTVRTILKNLETDGFLTSEPTSRGRIITICNFSTYQSEDETDRQADRQATDKRPTSDRQQSKNVKNLKELYSPPIIPPLAVGKEEAIQKNNTPGYTDVLHALRVGINTLMNRRETTQWSSKEIARIREISKRANVLSELAVIENLYNSGYPYRRKDIQTLLNNWTQELDRASAGWTQGKDHFASGKNLSNDFSNMDEDIEF